MLEWVWWWFGVERNCCAYRVYRMRGGNWSDRCGDFCFVYDHQRCLRPTDSFLAFHHRIGIDRCAARGNSGDFEFNTTSFSDGVSTSDSVRRSSHRQAGREAGHTRRSVLALSAASLAIGCESSTQRPVPLNNPLKDIGIARGRVFGCALRPEALDRPEELVLAARECALIAPIPMFVAPLLHRAPNVFDEADWARFKSFADACGATLHGHTLIWHRRTPTWSADWAREGRGRDALLLHVDATVRRFRGRLTSWDVVNEPLHHLSERPDGLRQSLWLEGAGADYVADAFTVAHEADPDAVKIGRAHV